MPLAHYHFSSPTLGKQVQATAILPEITRRSPAGPYPVLYLLHGLSDDSTIWARMTRLENLLRGLPLIVFMPDGYRGWYTNHTDGPAYADYFLKDVVGFAERYLPIKAARSARAIGGLSMGGYGAFRMALEHPGLFASAHSHSGALLTGTTPWTREFMRNNRPEFLKVFGDAPAGSHHDLLHLVRRAVKAGATLPEMHFDCGTDDFLINDNQSFHAKLTALRIPHTYAEHPGNHDWHYWDTHIPAALAFHAKHLQISA